MLPIGQKRPRPESPDSMADGMDDDAPPGMPDHSIATLYDRGIVLAAATRQQSAISRLDAAAAARNTGSAEAIHAAGLPSNTCTIEVLVQSITAATLSVNQPLRPLIKSPPNTYWTWTKYYKRVGVAGGVATDSVDPAHTRKKTKMVHQSGKQTRTTPSSTAALLSNTHFDLISSVASCPDLLFQVCADLRPADIFTLYSVSRIFKATIDVDLPSNILRLAHLFAPESAAIFPWALYRSLVDRSSVSSEDDDSTNATRPGTSPTLACLTSPLRYLSMLVSRDRKVRDIIACLARGGHRLPQPTARTALKKMWLIMDTSTNNGRIALLHQTAIFSDNELLVMQMFLTKLSMHVSDPLFGVSGDTLGGALGGALDDAAGHAGPVADPAADPAADPVFSTATPFSRSLIEVLLGQRSGLHAIWLLLRGRAFGNPHEAIAVKVRYDYLPPVLPGLMGPGENSSNTVAAPEPEAFMRIGGTPDDFDGDNYAERAQLERIKESPFAALMAAVQDIPMWEMGTGHLEGWGVGNVHLLRPDELLPLETAYRNIDMRAHLPFFAVWGFRDFKTGGNTVPTLEEIYMSDEDVDTDEGLNTSESKPGDKGKGKEKATDEPNGNMVVTFDSHRYNLNEAESRLRRLGGNVPCGKGEWQPWQVLKARWHELPLKEKLDIWWVSQQERLKMQAWEYGLRGNTTEDIGGKDGIPVPDESDDSSSISESDDDVEMMADNVGQESAVPTVSVGMPLDPSSRHDASPEPNRPVDMMDSSSDNDSEDSTFIVDDRQNGESSNGITFNRRRLLRRRRRQAQQQRAYPLAGPQGPVQASSDTLAQDLQGLQGLNPTQNTSLRVPSTATTATVSSSMRSFSQRHDRLVASYVQTALQQQRDADAALLAQADENYDEGELEWWEAALQDMLAAEDAEHAASVATDSSDYSFDATSDDTDNAINPDVMHLVHYGSDEDVLELLELLAAAEVAVETATDAAALSAAHGEVDRLNVRLDKRMKAEVFALGFTEY